MRLLQLSEIPVLEIQETDTKDLFISLGNIELMYSIEHNALYQYQDWPKNKELKERAELIKSIEDEELKSKATDEFKQWIKDNSKKVLYKVLVNDKDLTETIKWLIKDYPISKEYLND